MSLLTTASFGREVEETFTIYFRKDYAVVDKSYMGNGMRAEAFFQKVKVLENITIAKVISIDLYGTASPEGKYSRNSELSAQRMLATVEYLKENIYLPYVEIRTSSLAEDWDIVEDAIIKDKGLKSKSEVLAVIHRFEGTENYEDEIIDELKKINDGKAYEYIYEHIFPNLRACQITVCYSLDPEQEYVIDMNSDDYDFGFSDTDFTSMDNGGVEIPPLKLKKNSPAVEPAGEFKEESVQLSSKSLKVKTNAIALGIGHLNVAAEYAFSDHFSFALPFYYSGGYDYFKSTIKFRGIVVQPEFRYYFRSGCEGMYLGAHLGVGWYNFALNGDYRIQDYNGRRPAYGGGIGFGYVMQFKKAPSWGLEFALGAGVYDAKYDMFYNEDNGPMAQSGVHTTFVGVDNAAVSLTYKFNFRKKGGRE